MDGISVALAAGLGIETVNVYRRPKVAVISTGDELIQPGTPLLPGKIYDSNRHLITGRLLDFGVVPVASLHWRDEAEGMAEKIRELSREADLIVTTGGVSVGEKDILHQVVSLLSGEDFAKASGEAYGGNQASGALSAMAGCNCLIEIPRGQNGAVKGEKVWVYLL